MKEKTKWNNYDALPLILDVTDIHYDKKISDLQRRLDTQYDKINEVEEATAVSRR